MLRYLGGLINSQANHMPSAYPQEYLLYVHHVPIDWFVPRERELSGSYIFSCPVSRLLFRFISSLSRDMPFNTLLTSALGISKPVVQGGMMWVGYAELAAAVSNAGGLGILVFTQVSIAFY